MGLHTIAISRGEDKKDLALELGADDFIDAEAEDVSKTLHEHGGARIILATAPSAKAIESVIGGLGRDGQLLIVAATNEEISVSPFSLIGNRTSIAGWPSGTAKDSEATLDFSALTHITPEVETFPLEKANEAYARMINNEVRFRVVLTM